MIEGVSTFGKDSVRQVREGVGLWTAFAALLAWMFGLYWSDVVLVQFLLTPSDLLAMRALWLASEAATLVAMLPFAARVANRGAVCALGAGACLFAGTLVVLFGPAADASVAVRFAGVALTGLGCAFLLAQLGLAFARKGPRALLVNVALALVCASLLDACLLLLAPLAQQIALALLPALGAGLFALEAQRERMPRERDGDAGKPSGARLNPVRIVALPAIVGLAYGLMQRLAEGAYAVGDGSGNVATIASFVLSALVIALAALFLDTRKLIKAACFATIPVIGIAFVMLPLFSGAREAVLGVCIVGFNSFYFIVWALWADERDGAALPRRFALGLLVLVAAEALGSLLGAFVVEAVEGSEVTLAVVSLVVVYLLLMAGILSFDRSSRAAQQERAETVGSEFDPGLAMPAPASERFEASEDLQMRVERCGLSAREREVFDMLARGRNRAYISKTLVVSDNTTRTHMKNVYRKLGVHSQQELIDLVEGTEKEGEPG